MDHICVNLLTRGCNEFCMNLTYLCVNAVQD